MAMDPVDLRTARLVLWQPGPEAAERYLRFYADNWDHLKPWSPPRPDDFLTLAYFERRLAQSRVDAAAGRSLRLALSRIDDPVRRVIGVVNLNEIVRGALQQAFVGYDLDARDQGQGLMTEGLTATCRYAFDALRLHQLSANYMPSNERSAAVLRRCGFQVVGYVRDYLFVDGAWRDHVLTVLHDPAGRPPPD